jgi:ubiquinone/menaquinone biosynthesis C-methylase UbiE
MPVINILASVLRKAGLAAFADKTRYYLIKFLNRKKNSRYKTENPGIQLPPDKFIYETYNLNYQDYIEDGSETAKEIIGLVNQYSGLNKPGNRLLDWGCGPARVIRHFPLLKDNNLEAFGTDSNAGYIKWNSTHIPGVMFSTNQASPPTGYPDRYFNVIYGLSILTHLSEEKHFSWVKEFGRLLKPGGLLIITSQGGAYYNKLTTPEKILFSEGKFVSRQNEMEGSRIFSSFQPEPFMKKLLEDFKIVGVQKGSERITLHGQQDTWIAVKL